MLVDKTSLQRICCPANVEACRHLSERNTAFVLCQVCKIASSSSSAYPGEVQLFNRFSLTTSAPSTLACLWGKVHTGQRLSWVTSLHVFCLKGLWRSVSGNCVITETRLFGNDAIVHFGVFSENHLCVMYYVCALLSTCLLSLHKAAVSSVDVCFTDLQSSSITSQKKKRKKNLRVSKFHRHIYCV